MSKKWAISGDNIMDVVGEEQADYKQEFIDFLLKTGALRVGGEYKTKIGRLSPWFVNIGDFNDGDSIKRLGAYFADTLLALNSRFEASLHKIIPYNGS